MFNSPGGSDIHLLSHCLGLWESCEPMAACPLVQYEMKDPVTLVGWDTVLIKWISRDQYLSGIAAVVFSSSG